MSSRELINAFFDCLRDFENSIERCLDLFADDGVFEFPYFAVLDMPALTSRPSPSRTSKSTR
jgi:hypothetical protein